MGFAKVTQCDEVKKALYQTIKGFREMRLYYINLGYCAGLYSCIISIMASNISSALGLLK
jgi:hypothetical protein